MKYKSIWIGIGFIALVVIVLATRSYMRRDVELPPADATLAGSQEPMPAPVYDMKAPLSKNKIIYNKGMKIEITKEGAGAEIENGSTAVVSYVGKFENGTVFDASKNHGDGSFAFLLGAGEVIKGWDRGVLGMKVGETRILTVPPELGYGPNGIPGAIPGNATLIFEVTLLAIK